TVRRDADHAIAIPDQPVTRRDADTGNLHGHIIGVGSDTILAGPHRIGPGIDRIVEFNAAVDISAHAVNNGAADAAAVGDQGQNVAPYRGVHTTVIVDDDDLAGLHIINVVADRAAALAGRQHPDREGRAGEAHRARKRHDSETLPLDIQAV